MDVMETEASLQSLPQLFLPGGRERFPLWQFLSHPQVEGEYVYI